MYRYDRKNDKLMIIDTAKPHEMPDVIQYEPTRGVMRGVPKVYPKSHDNSGKCAKVSGGYVQLKYSR